MPASMEVGYLDIKSEWRVILPPRNSASIGKPFTTRQDLSSALTSWELPDSAMRELEDAFGVVVGACKG
jgi:hypothetical protein